MGNPFKKPKAPEMPKLPPPPPKTPARAEMVDLEESGSASNFEADLRKRRKKSQTSFAGETGGYGGNTNLG
jgi:hypothetical protein